MDEISVEELVKKGVVLIDKPSGPTSYQIVEWVKNILGLKKTGHAGTLDPKVTGLMLIALEESVKAMPVLMGLDKEYVGVMHLHKEVSREKLEKVCKEFIGKIIQKPPVRSAVARKPREKKIYSIEILEIEEKDALFKIKCEAGVYIRKLIHEIGEKIGGAHMIELRRIGINGFSEKESKTLQDLKDAWFFYKEEGNEKYIREIIIPLEKVLERIGLKKIVIKASAIKTIRNGAPLGIGGVISFNTEIKTGEKIGFFNKEGKIIALGIAKHDLDKIKRASKSLIIARPDRVFKI